MFPSDETATGFIGYPQKQWKRVVKRAGLTNLRPHDLRRSFASAMLKNVAALPAVGKALGHMDLSTTLIYARTTAETVREGVHSAAGKLLEFQQQDEAEAA